MAVLLRKLRRAAGLSRAEWVELIRAYAWVAAVHAGLRALGYARLRRLLDRGLPEATDVPTPPDASHLRRLATAVDIAARNCPADIRCLSRSLTLYRLVRQVGSPAELCIGVARSDAGALEAHAWVEVEGRVLGDRPDVAQRFARLGRWPAHVDRWTG